MRYFLAALLCWLSLVAQAAVDPALVQKLASDESDDKIAAIQAIAATADAEALATLQSSRRLPKHRARAHAICCSH